MCRCWGLVLRHKLPEGPLAAHKSTGMEGQATGGAQVCGDGWPDGAVAAHKGAGRESQMARGWVKSSPADMGGWSLGRGSDILIATNKPQPARGATLSAPPRNGHRGRNRKS